MSTSRASRLGLPLVIALLALPGAGLAQEWDKVTLTTVPVAPGIYMIQGRGGNIGVAIGEGGTVLVDSEFPQLHDRIVAAISAAGGGPVRFLLNTNWHFDHAQGNELFRKAGAVIVGHDNCPPRMKRDQSHAVLDSTSVALPPAAWPEVTFGASLTLHVGGRDIEAIHIAGAHSDADAIYVFRSANVIHTGDLFFSAGYPYIDIGNGGSVAGMIAAADRVLTLSDAGTKFIPGHGPAADRARLQAFRAMLATIRDRVATQIAEKKTVEQVLAARVSADLDSAWGGLGLSPVQFVTLVYSDLSKPVPATR
jgi:cyclase